MSLEPGKILCAFFLFYYVFGMSFASSVFSVLVS